MSFRIQIAGTTLDARFASIREAEQEMIRHQSRGTTYGRSKPSPSTKLLVEMPEWADHDGFRPAGCFPILCWGTTEAIIARPLELEDGTTITTQDSHLLADLA